MSQCNVTITSGEVRQDQARKSVPKNRKEGAGPQSKVREDKKGGEDKS